MALVVETGAGLATAESYLSVADADAYWLAHGNPAGWPSDVPTKENALRMATQYLDAFYGRRWPGMRVLPATQRLDWPRYGFYIDSVLQNPTILPRWLAEACAELALRHITGAGGLMPDVSGAPVASEAVSLGNLKVATTYSPGKPTLTAYTIVDALVRRIIGPLGQMERC